MATILNNGGGKTVVVDRRRNIATISANQTALRVPDTRQVSAVGDSQRVVAVSSPGPAGAPGSPGGTSDERIAGETLGGHRIVRSTGAGTVGYANSTDDSHGDDTVGMTLGAAVLGAPVNVQRTGSVSFAGWAFTAGLPVFLSGAGLLTQAEPSALNGDVFSQVVGHAEDATTLFLDIQPPIYLA